MRHRSWISLVVAATVSLLAGAGAAPAPAAAAECAAVYETVRGKWHETLSRNPDARCHGGSTVKIMTLHLALEGLRKGRISEGDKLKITPQGFLQGCTCLGSYAADQRESNTNDFGVDDTVFEPLSYHRPGETLGTMDDVLKGTAMSAAQSTVGIAEWVGGREYGLGPAQTVAQSNRREGLFVDMMNAEAKRLGLTNLHFTNEYGGEGALPAYKGDAPYQSARDMIKLWRSASSNPRFLSTLGLRAHSFSTTYPSDSGAVSRRYDFGKSYGYYPEIVADKNGRSEGCKRCLIAESRRIDRSVIADVMGSDDDRGDAADLLKGAFADAFLPRKRADSGAQTGEVRAHALACAEITTSVVQRCLSATRTASDGLKAIAWDVDAGAGRITRTGSGDDVYSTGTVRTVDAVALPDPLGARFATVARSGVSSVALQAWQVASDGTVKLVSSTNSPQVYVPVPQGVEAVIAPLTSKDPERLVLAVVGTDGRMRLRTYQWTSLGLRQVGTAFTSGGTYSRLAISSGGSGVMVAGRNESGAFKVHSFHVSAEGNISHVGTMPGSVASVSGGVDLLRHRGAFGTVRDELTHVVASIANTGPSLKMLSRHLAQDLGTVGLADTRASEVALAEIADAGQLLAELRGGKLDLSAFDLSPRFKWLQMAGRALPGDVPHRLAITRTGIAGSQLQVAHVLSRAASGDFVVGLLRDGRLNLTAWRVGPRS